jgi:tetratricopeptide (TPR) repeat protein
MNFIQLGGRFRSMQPLGGTGMSAFYEIVEARFNAMLVPAKDANFDDRLPYLRLQEYLKLRARVRNDVDELIRLRKLTAVTATDFENIARLYLEKGELEDAAQWLSTADSLDKRDPNSRMSLWASVHAAAGDREAAIMAQEVAFRRNAAYDDYRELMKLAEQAGRTVETRQSVFTFLHSKEQALLWSDERRAWTLARILKDDKEWGAIGETALARLNDPDRLLKVARWIAKARQADAGPVFEKTTDALVRKKTNRNYRAAVRVLRQARPTFDAASPSAFDECVSRLREAHVRKRNFMAALDAGIGKPLDDSPK